jgi:hypothetical protein
MRIQIEFDENGEIRSVAGPISIKLPDGSHGMVGRSPHPGHTSIEVEVEGVRHERDFEGLRKVMKNYRMTGHPKEPCLARKNVNEIQS